MPSKINGVGVFAIRDIPKGKDPFIGVKNVKDRRFNIKELEKLDKEVLKMIEDFFVVESDGSVDITENAFNEMGISFFMNHFKKPNLKIYESKENNFYCFRATRRIKKGEELTIAYHDYDENYKQKFK